MKESIKIELSKINFQFPETKNPIFSNLSLNLEILNDSE
jgi:ABC-type transport system involved in cytochrome bd biosynthesis fused ATPase/permease subunit